MASLLHSVGLSVGVFVFAGVFDASRYVLDIHAHADSLKD